MPTVKGVPGPYRFYFYSFDCNEPKHVHVQREKLVCKFWLEPVALSKNYGFSPRELNAIRAVHAGSDQVSLLNLDLDHLCERYFLSLERPFGMEIVLLSGGGRARELAKSEPALHTRSCVAHDTPLP